MNANWVQDMISIAPEIWVLLMAMIVLISGAVVERTGEIVRHGLYLLTQVTVLITAVVTVWSQQGGVHFAFANMVVVDTFSGVMKLFIYVATFTVLTYTRRYLELFGLYRGEFYALVLFAMLGMMVMVSGHHFIVLYIGLELLSLSLYALVALSRDQASASEAAMKYFVLGALASGMLLYGMSLFYGATGSLEIGVTEWVVAHGMSHQLLVLGLVFIVAGLAFKLGVVPFQMWVPDVYHGSPTAVTLLLGTVPKLAGIALVMRLLIQGSAALVADWQNMLIIMAVLSISVGNVVAIAQSNIKRMLAYSAIAHMGFLLLGFLSGSLRGYAASVFYIACYVLTSLGAFGVILLLVRRGVDVEHIEDLKGLNQRSPWYAFLMLLVMFSMAGVPPTIGFYAKFAVLQAALDAGFVTLVVFAVLMALVGAFYYLRIVKLMYFDEPVHHEPIQPYSEVAVLLSVNGLALLMLGVMPQALMQICSIAVQPL